MKNVVMPGGPAPGRPPEDIGDVLASIRRMIAQDDAPEGECTPHLRLEAADRAAIRPDIPAVQGGIDSLGQSVPGSREALLTNAQSWTRRQPSAPGLLRLQRSELVCQTVPAATDAVDATGVDAPVFGATSAAAQESVPDQLMDMRLTTSSVGDAWDESRFCTMPSPTNEVLNLSELQNWAAVAPPTLTETIVMEPAMNAYAPTQMPAGNAALGDSPDITGGTALGDMIRSVIRQELSDPSGRMSRELRAIILSEVARAISVEATFVPEGPSGRAA